MDSAAVVIVLRLLHIVTGVFWAGGAALVGFFLLPTVRATGPIGGQFAGQLIRRTRVADWLAGAGVVTILSGILLYWDFYAGIAWDSLNSAVVLGIGGAIAIFVLILGLIISRPTAARMGQIGAAIQSQGTPPTPAQATEQSQLLNRLINVTLVNGVLLLITAACMAIARYV